jgi:nucleotide-binding universal stress UspA family protein
MTATIGTPAPRPGPDRGNGGSLAELIVGVDGTYAAGEALGWAARLASASGATLTAVHAWQAGLGDVDAGYERAAAQRRRVLRQWCEPARDVGVEPRTVVGDGELIDVLAKVVRADAARGRRLVVLGRAAPGSGIAHDDDHQCDRTARQLRVPLAVAPSPGAGRRLRRVVLGLDESTSASAAATWLACVAGPLDLEIHAVTAFEPVIEWVPRWSKASIWTKVRAELDGPWTEPLRRRGLAYSTYVVEGTNVASTLTRYARRCHADAIVVGLGDDAGHRGRHPATDLLKRCHLPVILVPVETLGAVSGSSR